MQSDYCMYKVVTVPQKMHKLERMSDYRGVRLQSFHCNTMYICTHNYSTVYSPWSTM